ncbi:hypothetical protein HPB50_001037 [Hyalomma asiaticum]|uniref:Uncharacterized protein n=1 Tax=Hyalomma asiaticum TaxID=266040 RepID=A0ACB7RL71_HYAAI|nr:hypothetical protein HPB50_001037 [Hyalomma asiaticum]
MMRRNTDHTAFQVNEQVLVRNFRSGPRWLKATILQRTGPVSYEVKVQTSNGPCTWRRHKDHLLRAPTTTTASPFAVEEETDNCYPDFADHVPAAAAVSENTAASSVNENSPTRRYPQRIRKQPDRFQAS